MTSVNNEKDDLFLQYKKTGSQDIRDQIILKYSYLIKFIAGRLNIYFGSNVEYDDLISYGIFGLIDAIDKFDPQKGVKFETYASLRIRGSIIDSIREMDWVPRSLRQKHKELEKTYGELENQLGRSATDNEIAEKLGITANELYKLLNSVNISSTVSLEEYLEQHFDAGSEMASGDIESPENQIELSEIKDMLTRSIESLPEKEKSVISLYYFEELTLKEISKIMNVSESRISQLHTKALLRMRGKLNRYRTIMTDII